MQTFQKTEVREASRTFWRDWSLKGISWSHCWRVQQPVINYLCVSTTFRQRAFTRTHLLLFSGWFFLGDVMTRWTFVVLHPEETKPVTWWEWKTALYGQNLHYLKSSGWLVYVLYCLLAKLTLPRTSQKDPTKDAWEGCLPTDYKAILPLKTTVVAPLPTKIMTSYSTAMVLIKL